MSNFLSPGTIVNQIRKGPAVLPGIATAIGGFMLYTQRGPVGVPTLVTSPDDASEVFGGAIVNPTEGRMVDTLQDYFATGGASAYILRFIGVGSASSIRNVPTTGGATSGSESSNVGALPVALINGETFTGAVNGGAPVVATVLANRSRKDGAGATYAAVVAGNSLDVTINGFPGTQIITFTGAEVTEAAFLARINGIIMGAQALDNAGQVRIQTDRRGSGAGGTVAASTDADVLASLGLTVGAFVAAGANNVVDADAVTAAELKTLFDATFAGSTTTVNTNGTITWASNTTGPASSVQFTAGTGVAKIAGFDNALHSGAASGAVNTILLTASSPGIWGDGVGSKCTKINTNVALTTVTAAGATTTLVISSSSRLRVGDQVSVTKLLDTQRGTITKILGTTITFAAAITVPVGGYTGAENVVNETFKIDIYDETGLLVNSFTNLRMSPLAGTTYFVNRINSTARTFVLATDLAPVISDARPTTDVAAVSLAGGSDGAAATDADIVAEISEWDQARDVSFVSAPGYTSASVLVGLQAYAEIRKDTMVFMDLPEATPATGVGGARDYVQNTLNLASSYEAVYWPWTTRLNLATNMLDNFPPSPSVQGAFARTHRSANFGQVAAGIQFGALPNAQDLATVIQEQSAEYDDMYPAGVNAILKFPGEGIAIYGSRTMDPTGEFGQINVQIVFNVYKRLIKKNTRFVNFRNNDVTTRSSVVRVLTALFREGRTAGILSGDRDADAFFIICDGSNNTPSVIKSGKLICRVGLAVNVPVEFQQYDLELDTRALDRELGLSLV